MIRPQGVITSGGKGVVQVDLYPCLAVLVSQALQEVRQHIYQPKRPQEIRNLPAAMVAELSNVRGDISKKHWITIW